MLQGYAFYSSIGTIGTNGMTFIPLVLHWLTAYHYGDLHVEYLCVQIRLGVGSFYSSIGAIGTNRISFLPIGIPMVNCISL